MTVLDDRLQYKTQTSEPRFTAKIGPSLNSLPIVGIIGGILIAFIFASVLLYYFGYLDHCFKTKKLPKKSRSSSNRMQ
ncbi:hypothetical protein DERF_007987 [Dermatophagoides farinae]|uniref:Uncharacterized protein n=1 Tax=Dermatophagoides farinae TaxID=6954 RepID=A0A922I0L4_DERFA|nr:hypothetical protein HUG17_2275 [Dermatophagoides farinae]KAH9517309.1 hypothetical protein DERF_007987 [Dermatophagoides farinae]